MFAARTNDDIDGFDFKVDDKVRSLRFVLEIDGQVRPQHIEVGQNNVRMGAVPFVVRLD